MGASPEEIAKRYLDGNGSLREVLGIQCDVELRAIPLAQGEHNANFTFADSETGRKFVLRINFESQLGLADQVAYEARALEILVPSARTPRVLFLDSSKERIDHGVLVIEFFEGRHLDFHVPGDIEEAARILADIHSVRPHDDCGLIRPSDPLRSQYETCIGFFERYCASPYAEKRVEARVHRFIEQCVDALKTPLDSTDAGHIQNTEAVPSHFLISDEGPGHMVDWEKPIVGEVAQDVAYFMSPTTTIWDTDYLFDPPARRRFLEAYWRAVDDRFPKGRFEERYPAFVMVNALLGITWSCNAIVDYRDPEKVLKNQKTADLLGIYVSDGFLDRVERDCFERRGC